VLVGFLGLTVSPSLAASIGVNFSGGVHTIAASDSPGIVPAINWNDIAGASGTNLNLHDPTAITLLESISVIRSKSRLAYLPIGDSLLLLRSLCIRFRRYNRN